jgi:hypothetical protein
MSRDEPVLGEWTTRVYLVRYDDDSARTCYAGSPERAVELSRRWAERQGFPFRPVSAELAASEPGSKLRRRPGDTPGSALDPDGGR